jgi:hypothetical protein
MTIQNFIDNFIGFFKRKSKETIPNTTTTNIRIKFEDKVVGAIQSISITKNKRLDGSMSIIGKLNRVRFNRAIINDMFTGSFHPNSQKLPFDIEIKYENFDTTIIKHVWITLLNHVYLTDELFVIDYMEVEADKLYSKKIDSIE